MIIIDTREAKLIELIKSTSTLKIPYLVENLQIGDIIIRYQFDENSSSKTYNIILERKCITDMIASIKDGRYKEQKIRLQSEVAKNTKTTPSTTLSTTLSITLSTTQTIIAYILEGSQNELRLPQDKTMLNGSIISSLFRDKIPILRTYTLQETLDIIIRLHDRLSKDKNDFFPTKESKESKESESILEDVSKLETLDKIDKPEDGNSIAVADTNSIVEANSNSNSNENGNLYLQSIKKCKKDNINPKLWNQMCYMNIPGISSNIAIKISEVYPTIKSLFEGYENCSTDLEKELLLSGIVLTDTEKQKRRIGNVVSKRVYEFLVVGNC
jgi:ERCC4-type nuclease